MIQYNNDKVVDADLDALKLLMLDTIYPVGSIYMSVNNVSPSTLFGGTWEAIQDRFLLAAGSTYTAGDTGGSATHTPSGTINGHVLTVAEVPAHTHTRGTMNITGAFNTRSYGESGGIVESPSGAFTRGGTYYFKNGWSTSWQTSNGGAVFDASRSWTGETSSVGGDGSHNHTFTGTSQNTMPPYLTVYIWKRVS